MVSAMRRSSSPAMGPGSATRPARAAAACTGHGPGASSAPTGGLALDELVEGGAGVAGCSVQRHLAGGAAGGKIPPREQRGYLGGIDAARGWPAVAGPEREDQQRRAGLS